MSKKDSLENNGSIPKMNADLFFKRCMSDISVARDFLAFNLPEKVKSRIELDSLALAPQEYISAALRKKTADMVYTVKLKNSDEELGFLIVHVEQQTKPQRLMPLRMLEFMTTIMRQFAENQSPKDSTPIPVVIPVILSNHNGRYPYSTRFLDLFTESGQVLVSTLLNGDLPLVDLASTSDDGLKNHLRAAIMEIALKNVKNSEFAPLFMTCVNILKLLIRSDEVDEEQARNFLQNLIYYLSENVKKVPEPEQVDDIFATAQSELPLGTGDIFMTVREQFEQRGEQRAIQQVAMNMLEKGFSEKDIQTSTGLSESVLQTLKNKICDAGAKH